jgi:hypothetical protein
MPRPLTLLLIALTTTLPTLAQQPPTPPPATQPSQADLEKAFADRLTNSVMAGQYTAGRGGPKSDKYTIVSVRKLQGDNWLFTARIEFGGKDVTLPMIIPIKWAGDTPVISVTNLGFPGLGSYTARVLISGDQYAGTWQANGPNPHGGHLWGRIEKVATTQPAVTQPTAKPAN